jgi:hypothetical protein
MHLKLFKKNKETHPINVIISQGEILGRLGLATNKIQLPFLRT